MLFFLFLNKADDVLGWKGLPGALFQYSEPPSRRVPPFLFARLRDSLGDYVVERGANGATVLAWYHRQFWEAATEVYLKPLMEAADVDGDKPEGLIARFVPIHVAISFFRIGEHASGHARLHETHS